MRKAAVIGGGAAGMMTAVLAAGEKTEIHLYEKNEKLGKKLFITGKGPLQCDKRLPDRRVLHECGDKPEISVQLRLQL